MEAAYVVMSDRGAEDKSMKVSMRARWMILFSMIAAGIMAACGGPIPGEDSEEGIAKQESALVTVGASVGVTSSSSGAGGNGGVSYPLVQATLEGSYDATPGMLIVYSANGVRVRHVEWSGGDVTNLMQPANPSNMYALGVVTVGGNVGDTITYYSLLSKSMGMKVGASSMNEDAPSATYTATRGGWACMLWDGSGVRDCRMNESNGDYNVVVGLFEESGAAGDIVLMHPLVIPFTRHW